MIELLPGSKLGHELNHLDKKVTFLQYLFSKMITDES